ncbi:hypothetical protein ACDF64_06105 [Agromyces sp. MMS24-JH15]|uniref:hypothetical protein n=1 Tax=Agromyces sp. MMS24-JH15 TaxID=3243765 RepID=UPI003749D5EE
MDWWIWVLIAAAVLGLGWFAQRRGWIDLSDKTKRGGPAGVIMGVDEIFAPTRHEAQLEQERQSRLPAPAPLPGDGDKGIAFAAANADDDDPDRFRGSIRLDVER